MALPGNRDTEKGVEETIPKPPLCVPQRRNEAEAVMASILAPGSSGKIKRSPASTTTIRTGATTGRPSRHHEEFGMNVRRWSSSAQAR